jgi:hypothetical protein
VKSYRGEKRGAGSRLVTPYTPVTSRIRYAI